MPISPGIDLCGFLIESFLCLLGAAGNVVLLLKFSCRDPEVFREMLSSQPEQYHAQIYLSDYVKNRVVLSTKFSDCELINRSNACSVL